MNPSPRNATICARKSLPATTRQPCRLAKRGFCLGGLAAGYLVPLALGQPTSNSLPALIPAYGELPPTFWELHQQTIIVLSFAGLAVMFLFLRTWLKPRPPVVLPPEVAARQALAALASRREDGKLLSEVSQILRRYVSTTLAWPSGEMTTAEFSAALGVHEKVGAELAAALTRFLRECDEQKFCPVPTATPFQAITRAESLIALTEQQLMKANQAPESVPS